MAAEIVFVVSMALVIYTYVGYPILIWLFSRLFPWPVNKAEITPRISVIIAAHNEERDIGAKIEQTLSLDYPKEKLEVIVASDCSSDRTDEIVRSYTDRGVILHRQTERLGKTVAQNQAVKVSSGEILVFSDATTRYEPGALRKIVRAFADAQVGCVAGQLVYVDPGKSGVGGGCRSYWSYEKLIKRAESRFDSLIGVSGCLYAVRRSCHLRLASDMIDDFVIATEIYLQGLRTIYEPEAIAYEETNKRTREEFRMRVRVIEQTIGALYRYREMLDLGRYPSFAWQMISHKVLRYAVPALLVAMLVANVALANTSPFFNLMLFGQAAFYGAAVMGWLAERAKQKLGVFSLPYYFVLVNVASIVAFYKFMRGDSHAVWEPVRGDLTS